MRVLVVGSGAREHALCWALSRSSEVDRLFAAPGNPGMASVATLAPVEATDIDGLVALARRERIDLTVVGPEAPLVAGLVDALDAEGLAAFGPSAAAARIEGSKTWARRLCQDHGIPGPGSREFDTVEPALEHLESLRAPFVIKADGLAAGKGVTIAEDRAAATTALEDALIHGRFGEAGRRVLVEEFLEGVEVSALALTDGRDVLPLPLAQDYKRIHDGNRGPNTGGMGAYSPVPFVDDDTRKLIVEDVLRAAVRAMATEGVDYRGVLYAGMMLTAEGPRVLEFNCRFGDPETQVILPRLGLGLAEALLACARGDLAGLSLEERSSACVGVVLASGGYPGEFRAGIPIDGIEAAEHLPGVQVFHAGTAGRQGRVTTAGGRVLTVSALGESLADARGRAYEACSLIRFDGMTFRRDIAALEPQGRMG